MSRKRSGGAGVRGHLDRLWGEELFPAFRCSQSKHLTDLSVKFNQSASLHHILIYQQVSVSNSELN